MLYDTALYPAVMLFPVHVKVVNWEMLTFLPTRMPTQMSGNSLIRI